MLQVLRRKCSGFGLLLSFSAVIFLTAFFFGCQRGESEKPSGASQAPAKGATSPQEPTATSATKPDTARGVLDAMAQAYRKAKTYNDKGMIRLEADSADKKINEKIDFSVALERPNKLRMEAYSAKVVIDGKKFYASIDDLPGQVLEKDAPAELTMKSVFSDRILTAAACNRFAGVAPQMLLLMDDKAVDILLRNAEEPKLAEPGEIEGRICYRVQIRHPDGLAVLWIDKQSLLLRRMILPTGDLRSELTQEIGSQIESISLVAEFPGAQLNGSVDQRAFQFEVPPGAQIVSFFIPPHPGQLLGKTVPDFKFVDLEGKPITPQSLAGKITVLDFWATWCDPCKVSLPRLQKVSEKYKDNDKVAFLAVSVDEPQVENKTVEDVMKELKVTIPVCRDPDRTFLAFKFSGIPYSFIIDAKGIVQDFEGGANPEIAAVLPAKIDKLLAGENIYEPLLKEYQELVKQFISTGQEGENGAKVEEHAIPQAKIADPSNPRTFKLSPLWKCAELKSLGNIMVTGSLNAQPRLLVINQFKSVAEVGLDGKVIAVHELKIGDAEVVSNLRWFTAADGKKYLAVFAVGQQRCHLLDDQWNILLSYPEDALANPHSGIADVELGDLDGDGVPKMYVGYGGVVGVQAVSLEGKRIWSNRSLFNVIHMAITDPDADGRRTLLCTHNNGTLLELDAKGQRGREISLPNRAIYWITGGDLQGKGQLLWCGLAMPKLGETIALGLNLQGEELWNYTLPAGVQPQPIEPIIAGKITPQGPGQWLLPGPDGSINIISADGKHLDSFNYGAMLQGLATVEIDGRPAIIVASPNGLEAWKVE